eukprot:6213728-Pleurochrysis_carterae.AAC.2
MYDAHVLARSRGVSRVSVLAKLPSRRDSRQATAASAIARAARCTCLLTCLLLSTGEEEHPLARPADKYSAGGRTAAGERAASLASRASAVAPLGARSCRSRPTTIYGLFIVLCVALPALSHGPACRCRTMGEGGCLAGLGSAFLVLLEHQAHLGQAGLGQDQKAVAASMLLSEPALHAHHMFSKKAVHGPPSQPPPAALCAFVQLWRNSHLPADAPHDCVCVCVCVCVSPRGLVFGAPQKELAMREKAVDEKRLHLQELLTQQICCKCAMAAPCARRPTVLSFGRPGAAEARDATAPPLLSSILGLEGLLSLCNGEGVLLRAARRVWAQHRQSR